MSTEGWVKTGLGVVIVGGVVYVVLKVGGFLGGIKDALWGVGATVAGTGKTLVALPGYLVGTPGAFKAAFDGWKVGNTTPASLSKPGDAKIANVRAMNYGYANRDLASVIATFTVRSQPSGTQVGLTPAAALAWYRAQGGTDKGFARMKEAILTAATEKGGDVSTAASHYYWAARGLLNSGGYGNATRYKTAESFVTTVWQNVFGATPVLGSTSPFS